MAGWLDVTMCVHLDVVCDGRLRHPRYPLRRRHDDDDGHHRKTNVVFFFYRKTPPPALIELYVMCGVHTDAIQ